MRRYLPKKNEHAKPLTKIEKDFWKRWFFGLLGLFTDHGDVFGNLKDDAK